MFLVNWALHLVSKISTAKKWRMFLLITVKAGKWPACKAGVRWVRQRLDVIGWYVDQWHALHKRLPSSTVTVFKPGKTVRGLSSSSSAMIIYTFWAIRYYSMSKQIGGDTNIVSLVLHLLGLYNKPHSSKIYYNANKYENGQLRLKHGYLLPVQKVKWCMLFYS